MSEPAFHLVTRREFEEANPGVCYIRLGYGLSLLRLGGGDETIEVIHRVWDADYNEPFEEYLSEAEDAYVTVGDDLYTQGKGYETGDNIDLIRLFRDLDDDLSSYHLWSTPPHREQYPWAAEYEEQYGPDVPAAITALRDKYAATPGGQEALRYYRAHQWFEEHGVGDSW